MNAIVKVKLDSYQRSVLGNYFSLRVNYIERGYKLVEEGLLKHRYAKYNRDNLPTMVFIRNIGKCCNEEAEMAIDYQQFYKRVFPLIMMEQEVYVDYEAYVVLQDILINGGGL